MAIVPILPTVTGGAVYPSSSPSALVAAALFAQKPPMADLLQIVAQSLTTATFTSLTFTSAAVDQDYLGGTGHSNSTNTSRYTANYAGWYEISGGPAFAVNATGNRGCRWAINGAAVTGTYVFVGAIATLDEAIPARTRMVYLNVGDYVELQGYQSSGGALNTSVFVEALSSMMVRWVSN